MKNLEKKRKSWLKERKSSKKNEKENTVMYV